MAKPQEKKKKNNARFNKYSLQEEIFNYNITLRGTQGKYQAWDEEPPLNVEMDDYEFEQLLAMMKQNKEMDRLAKLRIEECKQLKFEYESEGLSCFFTYFK